MAQDMEIMEITGELLREARRTAAVSDRSVAGQVVHWAEIGRAVEPLVEGSLSPVERSAEATASLSARLASVDTEEGRRRLAEYLKSQPFPHYEPVSDATDMVVRVDADGTRTRGRFVGRQFQAVP